MGEFIISLIPLIFLVFLLGLFKKYSSKIFVENRNNLDIEQQIY
jgi:hypothetical protein